MNLTYQELCLSVCETAKRTGKYILEERLHFDDSKIENKGIHDLVSYVDRSAEMMIISDLEKLIPEAGFIAEEGTSDKKSTEYNWIIDPLDGTTNFLHGIPTFAISIALEFKNELIVGVVLELGQNECFYAWKGGGAYLNGRAIQVSKRSDINEALLATGFPYSDFSRMEMYMKALKWSLENSRGVRRIGSAATDLAYVACGRFDGFWEYSLKPWDVAAGALLIMEAGGKVTDFSGGNNYLFGSEILATNGLVNIPLQKLFQN